MKIKLYTCRTGLSLLNQGHKFCAYDLDEGEVALRGDIAFMVDEKDVQQRSNLFMYNVLNIDSVEIIGVVE